MPYCSKCGAKLGEDARFCPACGTPAGPPVVGKPELESRERERRPMSALAIALIAIVAVAAVVVAIIGGLYLVPIRTIGPVTHQVSVPSSPNVNTLDLSLTTDIARIKIEFEDLSGESQSPSILINASATGRVGYLGSEELLDRYMPASQTSVDGNVLTVTVSQDADSIVWPRVSSLNVTYHVRIDPSMKTSLDILTATGGVFMEAEAGVILESLRLEATTGWVEAEFAEASIVANDVLFKTTTGGVRLSWDNVVVADNVEVNALTTTGGVEVDVEQDEELLGNISLNAEAVTGGVDVALEIKGDIGARIDSSVATGGINVDRQVGFSGAKSALESNNYPATSNFEVTLKTTTGGINIDAKHTP